MKVWQVPKSKKYELGVRYSLFYIRDSEVVIGYDNHYPKGPHRHYGRLEKDYEFISVNQLIEDFKKDVERIK